MRTPQQLQPPRTLGLLAVVCKAPVLFGQGLDFELVASRVSRSPEVVTRLSATPFADKRVTDPNDGVNYIAHCKVPYAAHGRQRVTGSRGLPTERTSPNGEGKKREGAGAPLPTRDPPRPRMRVRVFIAFPT